ncbi:glycolipid transfer protein domain-containing protein [Leucosporidium creatinivorum]|uniref:Glycolipid transfer protein domain-containing protein n=1 Tax=Leucosporidium creatinivorum TaxID=106004 RepID=A0A1Y2DJH5_9BASI|nr:glycolipid transfer protein domain-containing protein [Leucosporidium creatinivorum]
MSTYFETVQRSYVDVPVSDAGVDTLAFLEATEGLIKMFDLLGNPSFAIVQSDMTGNVAKIRTRYLAHPEQSATLESLMEHEKTEKKKTATEGLLWLIRGLKFTQIALQRSQADKAEELAVSFTKAYEVTLKKFHSFVVKPLFALAMKACPYRANFYAKLGPPESNVDAELTKWLTALEQIIAQVEGSFEKNQYTKGM